MASRKKILLIDDSSVNNILLENILQDEGYDITVAFTADEGFEKLEKEKPDLILLDIMLPGMNGFAFLKEIKSKSATKDIPVIMVSAKSESSDIDKSIELGAADFIVKPVNIKTITKKIESLL